MDSAAALVEAEILTGRIADLERQIVEVRDARREVLRHATTGPGGLPVALVAERLGMSRQRVHKLLRS
jgi:hypothetical protein